MLKKSAKTDSSVLFIDASKLFQKNGNKNLLLPEHQDKIMELYANRKDEDYLAKLVKNDDILANDCNLSVSSYVVTDSTGKILGTLTVDPTKSKGWNDWYETTTKVSLPAGNQKLTFTYSGEDTYLANVDWFSFSSDIMTIATPEKRLGSLSVSRVPHSKASIALMVTTPASSDYVVHLVSVNGQFIGSQRGHGEGLAEFGKSVPLAPGMYFAIIKSGSQQKTMKLSVR